MDKLIIKRDGNTEPFNIDKINRVLTAAGLEKTHIDTVTKNVLEWLSQQNTPSVSSTQLREQIIAQLHEVDHYIEGLYRWYEKTKDTQ